MSRWINKVHVGDCRVLLEQMETTAICAPRERSSIRKGSRARLLR